MMTTETQSAIQAAPAGQTDRPALRQAASELVNQVFYGTMLRQLRESQDTSVFGGGPGGMTFVRQMDVELIKRMSARGDAPLAGALVRRLDGGAAGARDGSSGLLIELDRAGQETRRQITQSLAQQTRRTA